MEKNFDFPNLHEIKSFLRNIFYNLTTNTSVPLLLKENH